MWFDEKWRDDRKVKREAEQMARFQELLGTEYVAKKVKEMETKLSEAVIKGHREKVAAGSGVKVELKLAEPGHRYTAAWGEISQRIAQRQTLVAYYTTIGGAILSFSYLAKAGESDRTVLAYAIGPLSLMFAVLLRMHEIQIAILRSYLARIEKLDDVALYGWWYPKFHSHGKCSSKAQDIRMYHDRVAFVLVGFYGIVAACLTFFSHLEGDLKAMDVSDWIFSVIALPSWVWSLMWLHSNSDERITVFDDLMKSEGPDLKVLAATDSRDVPTEPAKPAEGPAKIQGDD